MQTSRSRRAGVEDRWYKRAKDPETGKMIKVPSAVHGIKARWRGRYVDGHGKENTKHFERKIDAQRWIEQQSAAIVTNTYVAPKAGRITFQDYAEEWRRVQVFRPGTEDQVERSLVGRIYPLIGDRPLDSFQPHDIQRLVKQLQQGKHREPARPLAPATVTVTYSYVSSVFKEAVRHKRIASSPCDRISLPEIIKKRVTPLTTEQVLAIEAAMPERLQAMVIVGAGTGMRIGEVLGLTVDRVQFLQRRIVVDRQLVNRNGGPAKFGPPKTATSNRIIPLPASVAESLSRHIELHRVGSDELGRELHTAELPCVGDDHRLLFIGGRGAAFRRSSFSDVWVRAMKTAELDSLPPDLRSRVDSGKLSLENALRTAELPRFQGLGFHDLRHYYASLLIRHGESVKTVQARLGHKNADETLNTYAHMWPDSDDQTRQAIDAVLGGSAPAPAESLRNRAED